MSRQLDVELAPDAEDDQGRAGVVQGAVRGVHEIGVQQIAVSGDELGQVRAVGFFLPLEDHLDVHRQLRADPQPGFDGQDVAQELALVVGGPPPVDLARAHLGLERL